MGLCVDNAGLLYGDVLGALAQERLAGEAFGIWVHGKILRIVGGPLSAGSV